MERCPNCAARWTDAPSCRRCGMDLTLLIRAEQAAEALLERGIARLAAGDREAAIQDLGRALGIHRTPLTESLLGFARQLEPVLGAGRYEAPSTARTCLALVPREETVPLDPWR